MIAAAAARASPPGRPGSSLVSTRWYLDGRAVAARPRTCRRLNAVPPDGGNAADRHGSAAPGKRPCRSSAAEKGVDRMVSDGKPARCRVGIDVGGTFTDFVLTNPLTGEIVRYKEPSVPSDPSLSVARGLPALIERARVRPGDVELLVHGTTLLVECHHPAPRGEGRARRLPRPSRGPRDRPHEPRQLLRFHAPQGRAPSAAKPRVRGGHPGPRGRERGGASSPRGPRPPRIRPRCGRRPGGDLAPPQLLRLPGNGARAGGSAPTPPARAPDHRVGRDLARAARVRARARRHHERVRAAPHERIPRSPGETGGRDGGEGADLHHRLERRDAQHRHRPGTADRHRAVRTRLGPRRGHACRPDPRADRDHHRRPRRDELRPRPQPGRGAGVRHLDPGGGLSPRRAGGERSGDRCGGRLGALGRSPGSAQGRPGERGRRPGARLLRPGRHPSDPHRLLSPRRAHPPPSIFSAGACGSTGTRPASRWMRSRIGSATRVPIGRCVPRTRPCGWRRP